MAKLENDVKDAVRIEADEMGMFLYRNQTGALKDKKDRWVRFGLGNESKNLNRKLKSADLIGIAPVLITADMVGSTVGVFVSIETKKPGWKFGDSEQDEGQEAWRAHIQSKGGFADIISSPNQLKRYWEYFLNNLKGLV